MTYRVIFGSDTDDQRKGTILEFLTVPERQLTQTKNNFR